MKIVYSRQFLQHPGNQVEKPARLQTIVSYLQDKDVDFIPPLKLEEKDLEIVHDAAYLEELKRLSAAGNKLSPDNPFYANTFDIAKKAAFAAYTAVENEGFALVRPPGHHAGRNFFQGFCYLNNIAFAVKKTLAEEGGKALIVDFDQHAGNGTQNIFCDDARVYCLSFHQDPATCFPFTAGFETENNEHVENVCLAPGTAGQEYLVMFEQRLNRAVRAHQPTLVAVSAGFDAYHLDTAAGNLLKLRTETYEEIGRLIAEKAKSASAKMFGVLEGGYYLPDLGRNAWAFLEGWTNAIE